MTNYKVKSRYYAHLYFEENISASNEDAAIRKAQRRICTVLQSITSSYDIGDDEVYVEKIKDEDAISTYSDFNDDSCIR